MQKCRRARSDAAPALATWSRPSAFVCLAFWASAQHAHAVDAASRQRDRADFGSRISYKAFPISIGGTADARSVGPASDLVRCWRGLRQGILVRKAIDSRLVLTVSQSTLCRHA